MPRGRPRKAQVEGAANPEVASKSADPVPGNNGGALARIVAFYKAEFPEEWEANRLCPLQHGLEAMIARLK